MPKQSLSVPTTPFLLFMLVQMRTQMRRVWGMNSVMSKAQSFHS